MLTKRNAVSGKENDVSRKQAAVPFIHEWFLVLYKPRLIYHTMGLVPATGFRNKLQGQASSCVSIFKLSFKIQADQQTLNVDRPLGALLRKNQ